MANTFKQVIPTANALKTEKSFSFDHITTSTFMQTNCAMIREVIPNMTCKIGMESFTRLNALVRPTFGRARVNNRMFFVPFRTIMPRFTQFIESEPIFSLVDNTYGLQTSVPVVRNNDLITAVLNDASTGSATNHDVAVMDGTLKYYLLGWYGHYILKTLVSLGYKINWNTSDTETFSAMPILAFCKVMIDWYYPSQYINSSLVTAVSPLFESDSLTARVLTALQLYQIFQICIYASYNDSVLVDAWDNPVAPNNGVESAYSIPDVTFDGTNVNEDNTALIDTTSVNNSPGNMTPVSVYNTRNNSNVGGSITQYQHDMLKALTDYTQRHRLSGVRAVDRYLAEYGINLSSEIMKRSVLIDSDSFDIQFGDVMAHSDTYDINTDSGAVLGDYAGKGVGYGRHTFEYRLGNEFGYLIIVNTVVPEVGYYQGVNRHCKHKSILDFWHRDFDGKGVQAVAADEVYVPELYAAAFSLPALHNQVFAFVPRYAEYKSAPSVVSGLFYLTHSNIDLEAFTLMRDLTGQFSSVADIKHDIGFVQGGDSSQYNRIFYLNTGKGTDQNFNFIHHFEVVQTDESAPLYETYDFENVKRAVEVHTQAAKVN